MPQEINNQNPEKKESTSSLEKALIASEIRYRRLFESAKDGILILDVESGKIIDVNPFLMELLGYSKENFIEKTIWEIGSFKDIINNKDKLLELQQNKYVRYENLPLETAEGRKINVEFVSNVYLENKHEVIQCNIRDITERKRTEEVLRQKTVLLEAQLNSSIDGIIIVDNQGKKILQNQRTIDLWKIPQHIADNEDDRIQVQYVKNMTKNPEMLVRKVTDLYEHPDISSFDDVELLDGTVLERCSSPVIDKHGKNYGRIWVFRDITERKRTEESLKLFRTLLDKSNDAILIIDMATGQFSDVNEKACTDLGYNRSELLDMKVFDIDPNQTPEGFQLHIKESQQSNPTIFESLHRRKDGSTFPVEINVAIVKLEKMYSIAIIRDITEKKRIENKLKKSEEKYRKLIDNMNDGIFISDEKGIIQFANMALARIHGYDSPDKLLNKGFMEFVEPSARKEILENFKNEMQGELTDEIEVPIVSPDGSVVYVLVKSTVVRDGQRIIGTSGIVRDITGHKKAEEALKDSEEQYRSVAESANDAIITVNNKEIIKSWNHGAEKIFGYMEKEVIGKNLDMIIPQDYRESQNKGIKQIEPVDRRNIIGNTVELRGLHKSGKEFPLELSLAEWETQKGKFFTGIIRDISERKLAEEEIKKKNEQLIKLNMEKDKFFSIIAHDLRNPFNGFLNLTELMSDSTEVFSRDELIEYSKSLNESARSLYKLLENLLEWAQVQKGAIDFTPKDSDLSKMVAQSLETIFQRALQKRISIFNEIVHAQKVYADEKMISTVLRNLLSNAVKFTRKDGKTIIKSKWLDNDTIEVSVEDNGVGISEKDINRLFKIEEKVSTQGTDGESSTGLGLLLCKEFIEINGGKIWVESELGKGSTFKFTLHKSNLKS